MKIERISLTHVRVPLVEPFRISSGAVAEKDAIVVEVRSDGLSGYGESSPMSGAFYSSDTPERSWQELRDVVVPAMLGRSFERPEEWNAALDALPAGKFTKTGVETALWDIAAKQKGVPLSRLLGGNKSSVDSGLAVGLYEQTPEMLRRIAQYLADGYKRVKIKIEPGSDVELVRAVRGEFGDIPLFVDANGAYGLKDVEIFRRLDEFNLMMFEQPFPGPDLEQLAWLQRQVKTPVCLDESLESADELAARDRARQPADRQLQNSARGRISSRARDAGHLPRASDSGVGGDNAGVGHRPGAGSGAGQSGRVHLPDGRGGQPALVSGRHHRAADRRARRRDCRAGYAGAGV